MIFRDVAVSVDETQESEDVVPVLQQDIIDAPLLRTKRSYE